MIDGLKYSHRQVLVRQSRGVDVKLASLKETINASVRPDKQELLAEF